MNALAQKIGPAQAPTGNVDLQEAARFLRLLDAEADTWRFRTIRDRATKYHGTLESCADRLIADNATRCVFVAVNDGIGDKDEEMVRVRAVFADLDGAPLPESFDLEPHIIVQTSPGKWHVYWPVDGLPLELFKPVQRAIAKKYSSDPAVCDLPRIMRLPGFLHRKAEPFRSHIIHESGGLPYDAAQILATFPVAPEELATNAATTPSADNGRTLGDLVTNIIAGADLHDSIRDLAYGMVADGMQPARVVGILRGIVGQSQRRACDPAVWKKRYDDIPRDVQGAQEKLKLEHAQSVAQAIAEVSLADLEQATIPQAQFVVEGLVPRKVLTLLGGHGEAGKTYLGLVIAAHVACGFPFAGLAVQQSRVVFLSFEDDTYIMRWRLQKIAQAYGLPFALLRENLRVYDGSDCDDTAFAYEAPFTRDLVMSPLFEKACQMTDGAGLVLIDNASDTYDADENNRRNVRRFVRVLARKIARRNNAGLILLAHIDKNAAKFGSSGNKLFRLNRLAQQCKVAARLGCQR